MVENGLGEIVGRGNILYSPENLKEYSTNCRLAPSKTPGCAVKPGSIKELQALIRWANEKHLPLVPVSSGPPHFRGDTIPGVDGAIIVDLRRMNKILRVNRENRVAIVEPGVTFAELQSELSKSGLCAYLPLAPRRSKSVLSSVLEREPIIMPCAHFDSTDPMLCTEIVFGTGDSMRTGEAAGPDTLEQQWEIGKAQISPFGPTQMDPQRLVSGAQGTIGIVTWMSLKCRFLSALNRAFFIPGDSLDSLIELSYRLTRIRFTGNIFILNGLNLAGLLRHTPAEIAALSENLPPWVMFVSCEGYGPFPEEKVQYLEADLKELAELNGLKLNTEISGADASEFSRLLDMPSPDPYWKLRSKGGFSDIFFLTTQGKTPEFCSLMFELASRQGFPVKDIGVYLQPVVQGTSCHCEFNFYYNPAHEDEVDRLGNLMVEAVNRLEERGAFFTRPYGVWSNVAYRHAPDTAAIQRKVKNVFDPNGILNPGKLCF